MIYGALPRDLGLVELSPAEMMFWLYCPIKTPRTDLVLPATLRQFLPIVLRAKWEDAERFRDSYVYLTAKTLYATPDCVGNRPGWHSDGFGTDDLNFIWYDRAPTEFVDCPKGFPLPDDCDASMDMMAWQAAVSPTVTFPAKHLLRLTPEAIHRCPVEFEPGMRTFVKVSVSADRYDLEGNSINHELGERWPLHPRQAERNHPSTRAAA
ncbi:MAG TPA: hypothetical protein VJP88_06465 [Caulobacteraceae bacterium]|nr:hypothetical protein [Caulobacteraceae bacterium]